MAFSTFSSTSALILFSALLFPHIRYWHTCSLTGRILSDQSSWKCVLFVIVIWFQTHCVNKHLEIGSFYCKGPEVQQRLLTVPLDDSGVGMEVGQSPQYNPAVIHVRQGLLASKLCWKLDKTILEYMIWRQKWILSCTVLTWDKFSMTRQSLRASICAKKSLGTGGSTQALV